MRIPLASALVAQADAEVIVTSGVRSDLIKTGAGVAAPIAIVAVAIMAVVAIRARRKAT